MRCRDEGSVYTMGAAYEGCVYCWYGMTCPPAADEGTHESEINLGTGPVGHAVCDVKEVM